MRLATLIISIIFSINVYSAINFATYNIRNFDYDSRSNTRTNKKHLIHFIEKLNADLLAVQEINNSRILKKMIGSFFQGRFQTVLSNCGGAHKQYLGFIYNTDKLTLLDFSEDARTSNPNNQASPFCNDGSRPLSIAVFKNNHSGKKFVAITLHLKSGGRKKSIKKRFKQLNIISKVLKEYQDKFGIKDFVVMGDFNTTEFSKKQSEFKKFSSFLVQNKLKNTTENLKCSSYWWGGVNDKKLYPSHLDHILISSSFLESKKTQSYRLGHCKKLACKVTEEDEMGISYQEVSDHCPLTTSIK